MSEEPRDTDVEVERIENHIFAIKQGDQSYIPEDKHTEQPDLILLNVGCIPRFPNNISSLLGSTVGNNDHN